MTKNTMTPRKAQRVIASMREDAKMLALGVYGEDSARHFVQAYDKTEGVDFPTEITAARDYWANRLGV